MTLGVDLEDVRAVIAATTRLRRITNPIRPLISLPTGVTVSGVDYQGFNVIMPWQSDWLDGHDVLPVEQRMVLWGGPWSDETAAAVLDPTTSDIYLGRLMIEDIAAMAAKAVIHEFLEFGAVNGRKLWEAHIPLGGATITKRIAEELASDPAPMGLL